MIFFKRRRLLFWLVRAYIRKWGKTIFLFFGLGLTGFFLLTFILGHFQPQFPFRSREVIGMVGAYTKENLPNEILDNLSLGLTTISPDGKVEPSAASSWTINDDGKTYVFHIKDNLHFTDGEKLTSKLINYNFSDVAVERPNDKTIVFKLKDYYSPFLVSVSRPIFKKNFIGLGNSRVKKINTNGEFVDSLEITSVDSGGKNAIYQFYPTEDSLKTALLLGEITKTNEIHDLSYSKSNLAEFKNLKIEKQVNYGKLITIFYNTQDKVLSDKRLREALSYAVPDEFGEGQRNRTPYPPTLWASQEGFITYEQDFDHSRLLLAQSGSSSSASLKFTIKTLKKYKNIAKKIKQSWETVGIKTDIEEVETLPSNFQIFLGEFNVSKDPDQYTLWHSSQPNNITRYKNLRIDKLLEDGRQTIELDKRKKIYSDFQKYLLDDPPATFLLFPYNYSVSKN